MSVDDWRKCRSDKEYTSLHGTMAMSKWTEMEGDKDGLKPKHRIDCLSQSSAFSRKHQRQVMQKSLGECPTFFISPDRFFVFGLTE